MASTKSFQLDVLDLTLILEAINLAKGPLMDRLNAMLRDGPLEARIDSVQNTATTFSDLERLRQRIETYMERA